jgi:hypothetical protein
MAVTLAATAFGPCEPPFRKAVFAVPPSGDRIVGGGDVQRDRGSDVLARDRRVQDRVGVVDHGLGHAGQPATGGPESALLAQRLFREVDGLVGLVDRERLDADIGDGRAGRCR